MVYLCEETCDNLRFFPKGFCVRSQLDGCPVSRLVPAQRLPVLHAGQRWVSRGAVRGVRMDYAGKVVVPRLCVFQFWFVLL